MQAGLGAAPPLLHPWRRRLKEVLAAVLSFNPVTVPRLESPTRSLLMEAPKGIQILAEAGDIQAICRNELRLESKDGEVSPPTSSDEKPNDQTTN